MEPPSASPRAGRGPWRELLLAVSLLAFWNPPTTAQVTVESVPPNAAEGKDALLRVLNLPGDTAGLAWFRGEIVSPAHHILLYVIDTKETTPGPAYSGRETIYPNGSLLFRNITLNDTGSYLLQTINRKYEIALVPGQLRVFQPVSQPLLTASSTTVTEDDSVVVTCSSSNTGVSIQWFFNGQILMLTDRKKLSQDNSTLTIDPVRKEDAGKYECEVSNPASLRKSDPVRLDVEVSLLAFWNPPTTAQVTVESVPPNAAEGKDVLLRVLNLPGDTESLAWFRGEIVSPAHQILLYVIDTKVTLPGPAYSGRETIYPNGSLLFRTITLNDAGYYSLQIINRKFEIALVRGQLRVFQPVSQPLLTASSTTVTEDDSVVLTCSSSDTGVSIQWFFNGQILTLTDRKKLSQDNSTLTIDPVRKEDAGKYECEVSNPASLHKSDPVRLDVEVSLLAFWNPPTTAQGPVELVPVHAAEGKDALLRVPNLPGDTASLAWFRGEIVSPAHEILLYVTDTKETTPGPAYSGRETIYPNRSLLFRNITLNDTGSYLLQIINRKFQTTLVRGQLRVFQPVSQPLLTASSTTVTEDDSVVVTCSSSNTGVSIQWLFNGQILMLTDRKKLSQDNSTLTIDPVRKEDAGKYECEVSNSVSFRKSDPVRLDVEDKRNSTGLPLGSIIGIALGVLLGLALVAALGCLLLCTRSGRISACRDLKDLRIPTSTPGHGPASRCTYPDSLPSSTAAVPIYQELQHPDKNIYGQINHKAEVAS
ncbi:Carcinoembryonic antigen-related cell adhesion molecule 3 [Vulpes lagopus]